ncbi:MAG: hypothetical protein ACI8S6_001734 [Myxococcota bacterium]
MYLDRGFPVELSVYPCRELRQVSRSSTDGQPIDRVSRLRLEARMAAEHPALWRRYCETEPRVIPDLEAHIRDASAPSGGAFDGLLAALSSEEG